MFLFKIIASTQLKSAVAYAHKVASLVVDALQGILAGAGLGDEQRRRLHSVLVAVAAVRDFLDRLAGIIGAPVAAAPSGNVELYDATDKLNKLTDTL